jgi:protein-S-isoprenylcysteine O-methyltransferase Ste14
MLPADQKTFWHVLLAGISLVAGVAYVYALWALGRKATYCRASRLSTRGIYGFTRNPQYATAIVAFSALGLAADAWDATSLCFALAAVYALMGRAEEPWLEARYGRAYDEYRAEVPRFFSFRHTFAETAAYLRKMPLLPASGRQRR